MRKVTEMLVDLGETGIELDPCSCADANKVVRAKQFLSKDDDGLSDQPWPDAATVFMNPPYEMVEDWVKKLEIELPRRRHCFLLLPSRPSKKWYVDLVTRFPHAVFKTRIAFERGEQGDREQGSKALFDSVLVYAGIEGTKAGRAMQQRLRQLCWVFRPAILL